MGKEEFNNLKKIIEKLRGENGCPWDRKQTIKSLAKSLKEENEEAISAIKKEDYQNLEEELGDLICTIMMMAEIAEENKLFSINTILEKAKNKLIERHTWVFGKDKVKTAEEALTLWKRNKRLKKIN